MTSPLRHALLLTLLLAAPWISPASAIQVPVEAPAIGDLETSIRLEFETRAWALGLVNGEVDEDLHVALDSENWTMRLAGLDAVRRAAILVTAKGAVDASRLAVGAGLRDENPNVVVMALRAFDAMAGFPGAGDPMEDIPWLELADAPLPSVRLALVAALSHSPVRKSEAEAQFQAMRLELLWSGDEGGLLFDADPEVRGAARQMLFVADVPRDTALAKPLHQARIIYLDRLVEQHSTEEFFAVLRLIARTTPSPAFCHMLSEWATATADTSPMDLIALGIEPVHFRGVLEAARLGAGGGGDCSAFVLSFANWVVVRADSPLEYDSWRTVDDLFSGAARTGGRAMLRALLDTALLPRVGVVDPGSNPVPLDLYVRSVDTHEEARRELMQAFTDSANPALVLEIAGKHCTSRKLAVVLVDQFVGGFDAAHLGEAAHWTLPLNSTPEVEYTSELLRLAVVEAISLHHTFHPSRESEAFLMDVMMWNDYKCLETGFKALSDARWSGAERFGLHSNLEVVDALHFGFETIWSMSRGVRLDLLIKLPRIPEIVAFAPIVIDVGDLAGHLADYRGQCVELLGVCEGSDLAAEALGKWLGEELDATEADGGDGPLTRAEELELSGFARAFAGVGAKASWKAQTVEQTSADGRDICRESLERLLTLSRSRSDELGKHTVSALAQFDGGLDLLADLYLHETGATDRRARIEAGIKCIQGGVSTDAALGELIRDYGALGWDLRDRVVRAIADADGETSLNFIVRLIRDGIQEHDGIVTSEEMTSAIDVLAWRGVLAAGENEDGEALPDEVKEILAVLTQTSLDASNIESRGIAIDRLGAVLAAVTKAGLLGEEVARTGITMLESIGHTGEAVGFLPGDEATYLIDKATLALIEAYPHDDQPAWLRTRVLEEPLASARMDLVARWRGATPGSREFSNRSSVQLWRGLTDGRSVLEHSLWYGVDGRLLGTMAHGVETEDSELAGELYAAALVALAGEPVEDRDVTTEVLGRALGLAWGHGQWRLAGKLCDRLVWARRRGDLGMAGFRLAFGVRSVSGGTWPMARLESLGIQARARVAMELGDMELARELAAESAALVGESSAAAADQANLEGLLALSD